MMDDRHIARWRLHVQRLTGPPAADPLAMVEELLAVQAENHSQTLWALGARCAPCVEADVAALFDAGEILRLHVLRPTWHFVRPDDLVWLVQLTAPRFRRSFKAGQRDLGIEDATLARAVDTVVAAVAEEGPLTRAELGDRLARSDLPHKGQALALVMGTAEGEALLCSGPLRSGTQTYALVDERAPDSRRLDRDLDADEALAELALRYLRSHGPATERDLAYWATLSLGDVRRGIGAVADELDSFHHDGREYYFDPARRPTDPAKGSAQLLLIFDEMYRGYQESRWALDADHLLGRGREPSTGMVLLDGQVAGTVSRKVSDSTVVFEIGQHRPITADELDLLRSEAERYGRFLDRTPEIRTTG